MQSLLLALLFAATASGGVGGDPHSLRLDLHRHRPSPTEPLIDHFRSLVHHDRLRQGAMGQRRRRRRACEGPAGNDSFAMPMGSAAYAGAGQYLVRLRVGTPAHPVTLIADTGSDLTWMDCRYRPSCRRCRVPRGRRPAFDADESRTFRPITCSSEMCVKTLPFSLTICPTPTTPCSYDYSYSDGSSAQGFYGSDSATVTLLNGQKTKLANLIVGCTSSTTGRSLRSSDGVLGLGYSPISFAAKATAAYGGRFSYCLVDHLSPRNATSYLIFGPSTLPLANHTPLLIDPRLEPYYAVGVKGISVAGVVLPIPMSVWDAGRGGGVIVDSGTSLTVLSEPAYKLVAAALDSRLRGLARVVVQPFEYCYNLTGVGEAPAPEMVVHLAGRATLAPPVKSYLIDVADGVKCIGLVSTPWPGVSTIGNILQQEHVWEFDVKNRMLSFQRSNCRGRGL